jgi:hypothetical protein
VRTGQKRCAIFDICAGPPHSTNLELIFSHGREERGDRELSLNSARGMRGRIALGGTLLLLTAVSFAKPIEEVLDLTVTVANMYGREFTQPIKDSGAWRPAFEDFLYRNAF